MRTPSRNVADNVFVMWRRERLNEQGRALSRALLLPWSLSEPLEPDLVQAITARLRAVYHPEVARNFAIGLARFEAASGRATPPPKRGILSRIKDRFRSGAV